MLATHCPSCGSPLFKIENEIVCPVCETRFAEEKDLKKDKDTKKQELYNKPIADSSKKVSNVDTHDYNIFNGELDKNIEKKISKKILDVLGELEEEKDFTKINMGLNCIKELISIIKLLKEDELAKK